MAAPGVMIYVQHLLGVGHLHRVSAIARAMARNGFATTLVSGGMPDPTLHGLEGIRFIQLPPARAQDSSFRVLLDEHDVPVTDEWRAMRLARLQAVFDEVAPDVLLTELFPFGRRPMRFELLPLLARIRERRPKPLVFCSVRDILVDRSKPERDLDSIAWLQQHYDGAFIHGDPAIVPFEKTFPLADRIRDQLEYTGYIVEQHDIPQTGAGEGEVLVSAGGGAVGLPLFRTALAAKPLSAARDRQWRILVSRQENTAAVEELRQLAGPGVIIEPVRPDFPGMLRHCLLSISKAGYNTVMETLASRARAVVVPFAGGEETEQALRANLLAERGLLQVVRESGLTPQRLADAIGAALASAPTTAGIRLDGADETVRLVRHHLARRSP
ncbi:MAG TPA: glycosyltransferase [Ferrovibrio sp.]|uniref:glycosyltransferase family protein n=1 Tax=Ferrovibrio sp. TaxID=1917215 RepID=UPI002B4AAF76|nr:glycosyltransferase [Ferrovibrio sp.]HLT78169.1 glycosyltransferase [Ferrovibrio sp.]